jgi:hypothetical protein
MSRTYRRTGGLAAAGAEGSRQHKGEANACAPEIAKQTRAPLFLVPRSEFLS